MARDNVGERERQLLDLAARVLPGGSTGNIIAMDTIIARGSGPRVWDVSGNEYIDYVLGSGPMLIGHAHPKVVAAVEDQLARGTTYFGLNEHALLLAEEIVRAVPCAEKVRFASSGAEATFYAMRVARAYRGRDKILKFEGAFHGTHDHAMMSVSPPPGSLRDFPAPAPDGLGIPASAAGDMLVAPFNDIETASAIIERYHDELAGVIIEPIQRTFAPKEGFLEGLRDVTTQYGVPLIFDEIVTGFRFAYGGAQEYYGVIPDLCALGKTVAGGFPLSAIAGRAEIMDYFAPAPGRDDYVAQQGTLNGNPVAAVAGLATLEVLREPGTYERLFATGARLKGALEELLRQAEIPAQVLGDAPMFDVVFAEHEVEDYRSYLNRNHAKLMRFNTLLRTRGIYKNHTKYYISTVHGEPEVEQTIAAWKSAGGAVGGCGSHELPGRD